MYPPIPMASRCLDNDIEVDGRVIKAGMQADIQIYAIHHHPDFWEKPEVRIMPMYSVLKYMREVSQNLS